MKTWEVIRDIKPGDIYVVTTGSWKGGKLYFQESYKEFATPVLVLEDYDNGEVDTFPVNTQTLAYEWKKEPKLVDFSEAWEAYENGKTIRPENSDAIYIRNQVFGTQIEDNKCWSRTQIRGKWEIIE